MIHTQLKCYPRLVLHEDRTVATLTLDNFDVASFHKFPDHELWVHDTIGVGEHATAMKAAIAWLRMAHPEIGA